MSIRMMLVLLGPERARRAALLAFLGLALAGGALYSLSSFADALRKGSGVLARAPRAVPPQVQPSTNALRLDSGAPVLVRIHPMEVFNFKSRDEILGLREERVQEHPELLAHPYAPSPGVFESMVGGRAWWGIHGIYVYGNTSRSLEGLSEESRFVGNPYLLVGFREPVAWIRPCPPLIPRSIKNLCEPDPALEEHVPMPVELAYASPSQARVRYRLSDYFAYLERNHYSDPYLKDRRRVMDMIAYNARDFGFNYLEVDLARSSNIAWLGEGGGPILISQYIHAGGSCGYAGGCNNVSPDRKEHKVEFLGLPAVVQINLWRQPPGPSAEPDMRFVVEAF